VSYLILRHIILEIDDGSRFQIARQALRSSLGSYAHSQRKQRQQRRVLPAKGARGGGSGRVSQRQAGHQERAF
jgi:hypothetical protein